MLHLRYVLSLMIHMTTCVQNIPLDAMHCEWYKDLVSSCGRGVGVREYRPWEEGRQEGEGGGERGEGMRDCTGNDIWTIFLTIA